MAWNGIVYIRWRAGLEKERKGRQGKARQGKGGGREEGVIMGRHGVYPTSCGISSSVSIVDGKTVVFTLIPFCVHHESVSGERVRSEGEQKRRLSASSQMIFHRQRYFYQTSIEPRMTLMTYKASCDRECERLPCWAVWWVPGPGWARAGVNAWTAACSTPLIPDKSTVRAT